MVATISFLIFGLIWLVESTDLNSIDRVRIQVDPYTTRMIGGIADLDRKKYFNLSHSGVNFESNVHSEEIFRHVVKDLNVTFGRNLGPIRWATQNGSKVSQDPDRLGFVNVGELVQRFDRERKKPNPTMRKYFGRNLGVASHGGKNSYPVFMGQYFSEAAKKDSHPHWLPENVEAAAELAATVFRYGFNDLERPEFFEPINEPHWSYFNDQKLADWHLATQRAFKKESIPTQVGGMCMSVCYFYNRNYQSFNGFKNFLDNTRGELDFYSFHVYDYLDYVDGDFSGRIQSGLPLEGVFDLVANYSNISFGKELPIVVSEHGGYASGKRGISPEDIVNQIAKEHFPGSGFEWEMEKRSIHDFNLCSSILTNTMNFLDHPHVVRKAVPFVLLESMGWDPKYYSTLYAPHNFSDRNRWVPSRNSDFFKFFNELKGQRVKSYSDDPDIQLRAFRDGRQVYLVLNNLGDQEKPLGIRLPSAKTYHVKRYGRASDFRPYFRESKLDSLEGLNISGREAIFITAKYPERLVAKNAINELPFYSRKVIKESQGKASVRFRVDFENAKAPEYVMLRIGFRRPPGSDRQIKVRFNSKLIEMPVEGSANRYENKDDYATTRIAYVNPRLLKRQNDISVKFPDGKGGTVGSVVLRIAEKIDLEK